VGLGIGHVERDGQRGVVAVLAVQVVREVADPVGGAGGDDDAVAGGSERAGRGGADAGGGARDEDSTAIRHG
jgi:hypothetical protein